MFKFLEHMREYQIQGPRLSIKCAYKGRGVAVCSCISFPLKMNISCLLINAHILL